MIASVLPGLREVRTPLAAGYILIGAIYALLYDSFSEIVADDPLLNNLTQTLTHFGPIATITTITFGAYLLGSIWTELLVRLAIETPLRSTTRLQIRISKLRHPSRRRRDSWRNRINIWAHDTLLRCAMFANGENLQEKRVQRNMMKELVIQKISETVQASDDFSNAFKSHAQDLDVTIGDGAPTIAEIEAVIKVDTHVNELLGDVYRLPVHLLGKDQEVWHAWDRLRAEAEFRIATSIALMLLLAAAIARSSAAWSVLFLPTAILFILGFKKSRESQQTLYELIITRRVSPAGLDLLRDPWYVLWFTTEDRRYSEEARETLAKLKRPDVPTID